MDVEETIGLPMKRFGCLHLREDSYLILHLMRRVCESKNWGGTRNGTVFEL